VCTLSTRNLGQLGDPSTSEKQEEWLMLSNVLII
jgi:hypothetical protein